MFLIFIEFYVRLVFSNDVFVLEIFNEFRLAVVFVFKIFDKLEIFEIFC